MPVLLEMGNLLCKITQSNLESRNKNSKISKSGKALCIIDIEREDKKKLITKIASL